MWTEIPKKIEFVQTVSSFPDSRLRTKSALDEPEVVCRRFSCGSMTPCSPTAELGRMQLRFRTESNLGMPASPYFPAMEPTVEEERSHAAADPRYRFRTESSFGMPISPWGPFNGLRGHSMDMTAQALPPFTMPPTYPEQVPGPHAVLSHCVDSSAFSCMEEHRQVYSLMMARAAEMGQVHELQLSSLLCSAPTESLTTQAPAPATDSSASRTTVMLRNLPGGFTRRNLLDFLDAQGFAGRYDFAYLPVSFETMTSLTRAFVNMVGPGDAERLRDHLEGFSSWDRPSDSVCHVVWNDKCQGLSELVERYRNSPVMHEGIPEECKPLIFLNGKKVKFPPPTQKIKAPKVSKSRM